MSDKIPELQTEPLVPDSNNITLDQSEGFVQSLLKKISDNKMYIYIVIAVIILVLVLYYFFIKNKKETMDQIEKPQLALPKQDQNQTHEQQESGTFNPHGQEYYIIDNNGNPVKVSGNYSSLPQLPVLNQQPSQQEIMMLQKQMMEKKMMEQQLQAQTKPKIKLEHPQNDEIVNSDSNNDIDVELARIKANEDENIAEHNLTHSELAEITNKLEMMNSGNNN